MADEWDKEVAERAVWGFRTLAAQLRNLKEGWRLDAPGYTPSLLRGEQERLMSRVTELVERAEPRCAELGGLLLGEYALTDQLMELINTRLSKPSGVLGTQGPKIIGKLQVVRNRIVCLVDGAPDPSDASPEDSDSPEDGD